MNLNKGEYFMWQFDDEDNVTEEISQMTKTFLQKFGQPPQILIHNPNVKIDSESVETKTDSVIAKNIVWAGLE